MPRLRDRNRQIPNGLSYLQPESGYKPGNYSSFDAIVRGLIGHRQGNPYLTQLHGWPTDYESVAEEVDRYNALVCEKMGWRDYIIGGSEPPLPQPRNNQFLQRGRNVVAGAIKLVKWISSGAEAVPQAQADLRAAICASCPKNVQGDMTSFFTIPVSNAIKAALDTRRDWKLSTAYDDKINVCEACGCPLKLKAHMPISNIAEGLDAQTKTDLHPDCWILKELL